MSGQPMDKEAEERFAKELADSISRTDLDSVRRLTASAPEATRRFFDGPWGQGQPYQTDVITHIPHNDIGSGDAWSKNFAQLQEKGQKQGARARHIWRAMVDALTDAGLTLSQYRQKMWTNAALRWALDAKTIVWLMGKGVFSADALEGLTPKSGGHSLGLVASLAPEGEEEIALLRQLHANGLLSGPDALFGITELACEGLWEQAGVLASLGEKPGRCRSSAWELNNGLGPIEAFVSSLSPRGSSYKSNQEKSRENREEKAREALAGLRRLAGWGAKIESQNDQESGTSFALAVLLGYGKLSNERAVSREMIELLGTELIALGARPNDGHALATRLAEMAVYEGEQNNFNSDFATQWAVAQGLNFSAHAAWVQQALAWRARAEKLWPLVEKFDEIGASISLIGPQEPSPVKVLLEIGEYDSMKKLAGLGAPMHYIDEKGECALHFLAANATKIGLTQLSELLKTPKVLALIGAGSQEPGHEGEQPLHRACAALNQKAIEQLLDAGADVNAQDAQGWTPLRHLLRKTGAKAQAKALPAVKALIQRGADPSIRDAKGRTPAQSAAAKAPLAALSELLQLRPEDIAGEAPASDTAKEKLRRRGGNGLSLAESIDLKHEMARAAENASGFEKDEKAGANTEKLAPKRRPRAL